MILKALNIGVIGVGQMGQSLIRGLVDSKTVEPHRIYCSNRSQGKLKKLVESYPVQVMSSNQEVVDQSDVIFIGVKPQDFFDVLDPIARDFTSKQIVVSLAAGISLPSIKKVLPDCRLVRAMLNTPAVIGQGTVAFSVLEDEGIVEDIMEQILNPLGKAFCVEDLESFEGFTVACSSGTGFIFELMKYWQSWLVDYGFSKKEAQEMITQTFLGTSLLASQNPQSSFEDLRVKVTSKQGVTEAGLESMREQELETALRISFEKAFLRNKELSKITTQ